MIAYASSCIWGALGESLTAKMFKRPMVWGPHEVGGAEPEAKRHLNWGAHGERVKVKTFKRPMVWGPHEVGGAEPEAKRPSTAALRASAQDDIGA